jgi:hypothetical protein
MQRRLTWLLLSMLAVLLVLCSCGRAAQPGSLGATAAGIGTTDPPPATMSFISNWQFSTSSTIPGTPPVTIGGSLTQTGGSVSGTVHVQGSSCFDQMTMVALTGTLTGDNLSVTSKSASAQLTVTGSVTDNALTQQFSSGQFTGTYTINGGCANSDQGSVTGTKIPYIANFLNGTFTDSGGGAFDLTGDVAQDASASPEGSFGISGTATINTACFSSGTITAGTFPSGSFIIGTSASLVIVTGNGTIAFLGTLDPVTGNISGGYTVVGGTCDQAGTAVLVAASPWDYGPSRH